MHRILQQNVQQIQIMFVIFFNSSFQFLPIINVTCKFHFCSHCQTTYSRVFWNSVADPGFLDGRGRQPQGMQLPIVGQNFCRKLHGNERSSTRAPLHGNERSSTRAPLHGNERSSTRAPLPVPPLELHKLTCPCTNTSLNRINQCIEKRPLDGILMGFVLLSLMSLRPDILSASLKWKSYLSTRRLLR